MKKILKISGISVAVIAIATLVATGALMLIRHNNLVKSGNVLGVSWYSEGEKEFTITTTEQLEELAELSNFYTFEGQTIKLGADLELNEGNAKDWEKEAPKNRWKPIDGFAGVFDGQGHTISGLYGKGHEVPMALFTNTNDGCEVRNLKLVNSYFETKGRSGTASFVVNGTGLFEKLYSDAIINHQGDRAAGISSRNNKAVTINECWFDGEINISLLYAGGIIDEVTKGNVMINHCLFSGTINSSYKTFDNATPYIGGICGTVSPWSTVKSSTGVTISDTLSSGTVNTHTQTSVGSVMGYVAYGGLAKAIFKNTYAASRIANQGYGSSTGAITGKIITMRDKELTGINAYKWTTLDFDRYWATVEDGTPQLRYFAENPLSTEGVEKEYDTSWYLPGEFVFEIHDKADLYGLALLSASDNFKDKRVKLCADIVLNEGKAKNWEKNEPALPWIPIFDFYGMFDGQGHSVSGIYLKTGAQHQGFFTTVQQSGVVKDLSILNSYFCGTNESLTSIGSVSGDFRGKMEGVYSNAIIVGYGQQMGGLFARANDNDDPGTNKADKIEVLNCWFDGEVHAKGETTTYAAGLVGCVVQGDLEVAHCLNTGTIYSECKNRAIHVSGLVGSVSHVEARLVLKDSLNAGMIKADYDVGVGSVIGRLSSEKHSANISDTYTLEESHIKSIGTSSGTIKGGAIRLPKSILTGKNAYRFSTLDYTKYWTTTSNGTPVLRKFASSVQSNAGMAKAIDISWYNDDAKTFTIKNLKQFYGFAFLATGNNFEGKTVKLATDITVNTPNMEAWQAGTAGASNPWVSIGNEGMEFNGTFNGQNHTIRGIYVKSDTRYTGLFGRASYDSVIKNFKLTDSYFCNTNKELCSTASISGEIRGRMENVYSNAVVVGYGPQIGGMVARINDYDDYKRETKAEIADKVVVKNCWFDGTVRLVGSKNTYAGGVVGCLVQGDLEMTDCLNTGTVISEKNDTSGGSTLHVGGVLGSQSHAESRLVMSNCLNVGNIVTEPGMGTAAGAILGRVSGANHTATIKNVFSTKESYSNIIGWSNGIVNGKEYMSAGANDVAGTKLNRTQLVLRTDAEVKAFFGPTTSAWTCDTINNGYDRGTPILKYFASWWLGQQPATEEKSDTSWYNTTDKEFEINTAEKLNGLAELSAKYDFAGQTFKLTEDIKMNDVDTATLKAWEDGAEVPSSVWAPIGSEEVPFAGAFDGQGHTISGLYMKTNANGAGLFGVTGKTASFKDFRLVDSYLSSNGTQLGGIVGIGAFTSMENIYVNATVKATNSYVGGFVGQIDPADVTTQINNCWFDGKMIQVGDKVHSVGGFIGNDAHATPIIFKNCLMSGEVSGGYRVGGFIGWKNNYSVNEFHNCLSVGSVVAHPTEAYEEYKEVGSYYGHFNTSTYNVKFYNSYASGERITGVYKNASDESSLEISAYLKDRDTLIATGEKTLFPALLDEQENAWVNDIGCNDTDRGTPILKYFADDWFIENPADGLKDMPESKTDSEWYNETDTTFTITTVEEFLGFAELVNAGTDDFAGKTVKLGANIQLNDVDEDILLAWIEGTKSPEVEWVPVGTVAKPFAGTFDGQGHEIKGLYLNTVVDKAGLFGNTVDTAVIKDFKLTYSYLSSKGIALGGIVGYGMFASMSDIYSNAIVYTTNSYAGGFVGQLHKGESTKTAQIENCWFDGAVIQDNEEAHSVGGFVGNDAVATPVIFKNCLSYGIVIGGYRVGGFYGWKNNYSVNEYYNCLSVSMVGATSTDGSYAKMVGSYFGNYNTSTWNLKLYNSYALSEPLTGVYSDSDGPSKFENETYLKDRMTLIETSEKKLFPKLEGEDKNAWVNDIGYNDTDRGTPVLEKFADWWFAENPASGLEEMPGIKADTSWYNEADNTFTLATVQQLLGFAEIVNSGKDDFAGKNVKLGADIKLNEVNDEIFATWVSGVDVPDVEWTPVGTEGTPFAGTFDGQGHTISGLYMSSTTTNSGFFGKTSETVVLKNFRLVDSYMESKADCLGLIGRGNFASIESVYSNAVMRTTAKSVGGFIGTIDAGATTNVIKNCWFDGEILQTGTGVYNAGGFVGDDAGAVPIKFVNCLMTGSVTGVDNVGGFYGFHSYYGVRDYYNCLSVGTVIGTTNGAYAGGVVGNVNTSTWNVKMYNTYTNASTVIFRTKAAGETDKYNNETYLKTRDYLIEADEAELFPVLSAEGETENAWVNDIGYNATNRGTPILTTFADWWMTRNPADDLLDRPTVDPSVDTSWYNDTDTTFTLMDAADLLGFAKLGSTGNTFAGKTVKLGADIALNEVDATILEGWKDGSVTPEHVWTPVGTSTAPFAGTFDGQGYTISGLYLDADVEGAGLFGHTASPSEFKNFKLVDSVMKNSAPSLGIVGKGAVVLMENIYTNAIMISTATDRSDVAGFIGTIDKYVDNTSTIYTTISNCWFDGYVQQANTARKAGGFIAGMSGAATTGFYNCLSTGTVTGGYNIGGFYGARDTYAACETKNCLSVATVTANPVNTANASKFGSYYGDHTTSAWNSKMYTSYAVNPIVGSGNVPATGTLKTREELVDADVAALFPESTAWVQDPYWNTTNRGTPILASFAEWWLDRQPTEGLSDRIDTSWYSESGTEFTLTKASQLLGFSQLAKEYNFAGQTIKLGADMVLNKVDEDILKSWQDGTVVPKNKWTPIGNKDSKFAGIFDGQGYTISGLYLNTDVEGSGLFGHTASPSEIKNFKLVDSVMKNSAPSLGIIGKGAVVLMENIYTNAIMISTATDRSDVAGFIGTIDKYVDNTSTIYTTISNCWFDGYVQQANTARKAGGFIAGMSGAATTGFYNCLSTGTVTGGYNIGGFYGARDTYAACETKNCLSVATVTANPVNTANASKFGSYYGDHTTSAWNSKMYTSYAVNPIVGSGNVPATGTLKTREELVNADVAALFPESTAWVQDPSYNATDRGTPILASFAEWWLDRQPIEGATQRIDKSWYESAPSAAEYTLTKPEQLYGLAELSQTNSFAGKTIKLGADITLNEVSETILAAWKAGTETTAKEWTPIGSATTPFAGTFDGQGHTIKGLYLNATTNAAGLFGTTAATAVIRDFELVDSCMKSSAAYLGLIGEGFFTKIEKVYTNAIICSTGNYVAGFIGRVMGTGQEMLISNCWFDGEIIQTTGGIGAVGGFVGQTAQSTAGDRPILAFKDCLNTGSQSGYNRVGGFIGWHAYGNKQTDNTFENCLMVGTVSSDNTSANKGMFIGHADTSGKTKITNSYTTGSVVTVGGSASYVTYSEDVFKTNSELQNTGVATLFPSSTAWKNVTGKTPVLTYFAD